MTVWSADYDPFGKAEIKAQEIVVNLRFPGQYFDAETDTHYNYQRDYDPQSGRYLTADPIGLQGGTNLYAYVGNNPLALMDPRGESPLSWLLGKGAKKAAKEFMIKKIKNDIKPKLKRITDSKLRKQLEKELDLLMAFASAGDPLWIQILEWVPIAGDVCSASRFLIKGDKITDWIKKLDKAIDKAPKWVVHGFDNVADAIKKNGKLPDGYISKADAKKLGWNPKKGNLAEVAPGKTIGGDIFTNREGLLPKSNGRVWKEADVNYTSGYRGSDRILYSSDGLVYKTTDHYKTFTLVE